MTETALPKVDAGRWKAIILVAVIATFVRIMMQPLIPEGEGQAEQSILVGNGLLIPAFTVYALIAYIIMAYVFVFVERGLPWTKMMKGLAFGSALGLIWVAYLFEPVPLGEGTPFIDMLAYPIADGLSVIVLGVLLGRFVATEGRPVKVGCRNLLPLVTVPLVMLAFRLFEYNVLNIYSSYDDRTVETVIWVAVTGLCVAIAYLIMSEGVPCTDARGRSLAFGIVFYGVPIAFVNFFVVLAVKIDVADLALRSAIDTFAVILGIYLAERFS